MNTSTHTCHRQVCLYRISQRMPYNVRITWCVFVWLPPQHVHFISARVVVATTQHVHFISALFLNCEVEHGGRCENQRQSGIQGEKSTEVTD